MEFVVSYSELLSFAEGWAVRVGNGKVGINKISPDGEKSLLVDATVRLKLPIVGLREQAIRVKISILQSQGNRVLLHYQIGDGGRLFGSIADTILSALSMPTGVALLDGNRVDIRLDEMDKIQAILAYVELSDIQTKEEGVHIYGNYKKRH